MNAPHSISTTPVFIGQGTKSELEHKKQLDKETRILAVMLHNLTTNEPKVQVLKYTFTPIGTQTIIEKLRLMWFHINEHPNQYAFFLGVCTFFIVLGKVAQIASRYIIKSYDSVYQQILKGQLTYASGPRIWQVVRMDYYHNKLSEAYFTLIFSLAFPALIVGTFGFAVLSDLIFSLNSLLTGSHQLTTTIETKTLNSIPIDEYRNNRDDQGLLEDPLTGEGINPKWAHAPRFIKVGKMLYTLKGFFIGILRKPLDNGVLLNPILLNTPLSLEDHNHLMRSLSDLFGIDEDQIHQYWDPYYRDPRKCEPDFARRVAALPQATQQATIEESLFRVDLKNRIAHWASYSQEQQDHLATYIRPLLFLDKRTINFLKTVPDRFLDTRLFNTDSDSFTLRETLKDAEERVRTFIKYLPARDKT
jgi:hypothetical protein